MLETTTGRAVSARPPYAKEHSVKESKQQRIDLDGPMTPAQLHGRVERLAVPTFDWMSEPILAITNGVTGASRH